MARNKGYGLIILLVVVAIIAFWTVKVIGKNNEQALNSPRGESGDQIEPDLATTPTGAIQTKAKAQAAIDQESAYNQQINEALEE